MLWVSFTLLFFALSQCLAVFVSRYGVDNFLCLYSPSTVPCRTLNYASSIAKVRKVSNVTVFIEESSSHSLQEATTLKGLFFLSLIGKTQEITTLRCNNNVGLSFRDIAHVKVSNIKLIGCQLHSLSFFNCSLELRHVIVMGSIGSGAVVQSSLGYMSFVDVFFINNSKGGLVIKERESMTSICSVRALLYSVHFINNTEQGGLIVNMGNNDSTTLLNITVTLCTFTGNKAVFGGSVSFYGGQQSSILFSHSNFSFNSALTGGGLAAVLTGYETMTFESCSFSHNSALKGAAIHIRRQTGTPTYPRPVNIINSSFKLNTIEHITNISTLVSEYGTVVSHHVSLWFKGECSFNFNNASGVAIGGSVVVSLGGDLRFKSNTGMNGGAIALYDGSAVVIREGLKAVFANNRAINRGPALYFSHVVPRHVDNCILLYSSTDELETDPNNWNCSMTFLNNSLSSGLNGSFYISSLSLCSFPHNDTGLLDLLCSKHWHYQDSHCRDQIITGPSVIFNDSLFTVLNPINTLIPIQTHDELGHEIGMITPIVFVSFGEGNSSEQTVYANNVEASTPFIVSQMSFAIRNGSNQSKVISFWSVGDTTTTTKVTAYIRRCPPGNYFNRSLQYCHCVKSQFFLKCHSDSASRYFYLKKGWLMTYDFETDSVYAGSQKFYQPLIVPHVDEEQIDGYVNLLGLYNMPALNEFSCGGMNREGMLCSQCQNGFGVAVNSYNFICERCTREGMWKRIVYFFLLTVLPGIVFCFFLTLLNVRVASEGMNAFIIYSQIISHPFIAMQLQYQFNEIPTQWTKVLYNLIVIPYGFWNLDFFKTLIPPFCISPGMANIHAWSLQYLSAILPLLLILTLCLFNYLYDCGCKPILCLARPFCRLRRHCRLRINLINVFATFFLLSYTKLLYISVSLLSYVHVYVYENVEAYEPQTTIRVYLQPDYKYFCWQHLPYAVTATILLFIILLPPVLLIAHSKGFVSCRRCHLQLSVSAFTDVFYGSYKDGVSHGNKDCRYFAGIDLLSRFAIITILNLPFGDNIRYLVLPLILATAVMLVTYIQPYRKNWANLLHGIFLSILISVVMTFSPLNSSYGPLGSSIALVVIAWVFTMIPMVYMILYTLWSIYRRMRRLHKRYNKAEQGDVSLSGSVSLPYRLNE